MVQVSLNELLLVIDADAVVRLLSCVGACDVDGVRLAILGYDASADRDELPAF